MKLRVPFFLQTSPLNCGPVALKMVLSYFGDKSSLRLIEKRTGILPGKGVSTIQLAIASSSLGYKTQFFSKHLGFNPLHLKHEFYKKYSNMNEEKSNFLHKKAGRVGVVMSEKKFSLLRLLSFVSRDSIPIVLLDWNVIIGKKGLGYQGHFVPIVGYDSKNVYVHNHGFLKPTKFFAIRRKTFDLARKSSGTDEDFLVVSRK